MKIVVASAGHAPVSGTSRLGRLVEEAVQQRLAATTTFLELRELALEVTTSLIEGKVQPGLDPAIEAVSTADAVVLLTPTINASFSGLLKCFLDVLPRDALRGMPILIGATGGTQRHTLVLDQSVRPMLAFLRALIVPSCLFVTADQWEGRNPNAELKQRVSEAVEELAAFVSSDHRRRQRLLRLVEKPRDYPWGDLTSQAAESSRSM